MARNFFKAGMSLLQQVTNNRNDSSDEDEPGSLIESEDYIKNGQKGILVFRTYSVKSDRYKTLHINIYNGQFIQFFEQEKKVYSCGDVQSICRNADNNVVVDIKRPMEMQGRQKKLIFETEAMASKFHQYVEFIKESGKQIRTAFNQIDYKRIGVIDYADLKKAMSKVDLKVSDEDIHLMLQLHQNVQGTDQAAAVAGFDYCDFFGLFMDSFVSDMRECLQEWLVQATTAKTDLTSPTSSSLCKVDTTLNTLPGEVVAFAPTERVHWCVYCSSCGGNKPCKHPHFIPGLMYATNYRVVLFSIRKSLADQHEHTRYDVPSYFNMVSVPLATLHRVYIAPPRNSIYLVCKDFRTMRVTLSGFENSRAKVETFVQLLQSMCFYNASSLDLRSHLFAYKYCAYFSHSDFGWNVGDIIKEYVRQGLYDSPQWQVFDNSEWQFSSTYPRYLVLPAKMTEAEIVSAAAFRSKNRLPAITYVHRKTGAVLTRSAQPMVGITQKNCAEDATLLNLYRTKGASKETLSNEDSYARLYILDARGKMAATLNMAVGKGTEDITMYQGAELVFCNIDNIHVMRSSANALADTLAAQSNLHSNLREVLQGANVNDGSGIGYYSKVEESGWLRHVRLVLMASVFAAEKLHFEDASVLIHCSDGWDRTAQTCSLVQLILDPYFRTIEGLAVLIEKEWCSFGHKFQDRCGHGYDHLNMPDERSPVFLQFLDSLFQLMQQFPSAFEFSTKLLLFLADHVHSCLFGNFLGNSDRERSQDLQVRECTRSIWAYVLDHKELFLNKSRGGFVPYPQPIWPVATISRITLWSRYWQRWDVSAHPNSLDDDQWHDDWGSGLETDPAYTRSSYTYVAKPKREFTTKPAATNLTTSSSGSGKERQLPPLPSPPTATPSAVPATPPVKPRKVSLTVPATTSEAAAASIASNSSATVTSSSDVFFTAEGAATSLSAAELSSAEMQQSQSAEEEQEEQEFQLVDVRAIL